MNAGAVAFVQFDDMWFDSQVMNVGSDFFPESVWKIYVVNAPMIFRAMWGIIKPWVHPITQAKVGKHDHRAAT